jgi:hypothetical protein
MREREAKTQKNSLLRKQLLQRVGPAAAHSLEKRTEK